MDCNDIIEAFDTQTITSIATSDNVALAIKKALLQKNVKMTVGQIRAHCLVSKVEFMYGDITGEYPPMTYDNEWLNPNMPEPITVTIFYK